MKLISAVSTDQHDNLIPLVGLEIHGDVKIPYLHCEDIHYGNNTCYFKTCRMWLKNYNLYTSKNQISRTFYLYIIPLNKLNSNEMKNTAVIKYSELI